MKIRPSSFKTAKELYAKGYRLINWKNSYNLQDTVEIVELKQYIRGEIKEIISFQDGVRKDVNTIFKILDIDQDAFANDICEGLEWFTKKKENYDEKHRS